MQQLGWILIRPLSHDVGKLLKFRFTHQHKQLEAMIVVTMFLGLCEEGLCDRCRCPFIQWGIKQGAVGAIAPPLFPKPHY